MAFKRWGCEFEGPWPDTGILKAQKGVWVIWKRIGRVWEVIDVGESSNVRAALTKPRQAIHGPDFSYPPTTILYSATYTPHLSKAGRQALAQKIRSVAVHA